MSIYVGISGRTAVSVLAQYIKTLRHGGVMPLILRTDRGGETPLVADAHYQIRNSKRAEGEDPITFLSAFRFGTSKQNSRIETWWEQNGRCTMSRWRGHFKGLVSDGEYLADSLADRIAFLAIYMPIVRHDVATFVNLWNTHKIRKQKNRPYAVCGRPGLLYRFPECPDRERVPGEPSTGSDEQQRTGEQCGLPVNSEDIEAIEQDLQPFRKRLSAYQSTC